MEFCRFIDNVDAFVESCAVDATVHGESCNREELSSAEHRVTALRKAGFWYSAIKDRVRHEDGGTQPIETDRLQCMEDGDIRKGAYTVWSLSLCTCGS